MSKEAMKLALEALNRTESDCGSRAWEREQEAIKALEEALASEQEQRSVSEQLSTECVSVSVGEPVAWMNIIENNYKCLTANPIPNWTPLYTTPQQRKPLTDEKIRSMEFEYIRRRDFARAIEAAHGIKSGTDVKE